VKQNGNGGRGKPSQDPGVEKANHAEREGGVSASRRTIP
jgi:hypothetical protein